MGRTLRRLCNGDTPSVSERHGVYCLIVTWALLQMATVRCGTHGALFSTCVENKRKTERMSGRAVGIRLAGESRITSLIVGLQITTIHAHRSLIHLSPLLTGDRSSPWEQSLNPLQRSYHDEATDHSDSPGDRFF